MSVALQTSEWLLDSQPDDQLVNLARAGHASAFAEIVRRYRPELQAQARRLTSDGRAEDVVQQVFLNAFTALQSGARVQHLRGWLHQILRNVATKGHVPVESPLQDASVCGEPLEDLVQRRSRAHAALTELSALPPRQRDALVDTALHGFPRAQIAKSMGLSEGAVRQLVHRARLTLRQAATGLLPLPVAKFFGGLGDGATVAPEITMGAGTAAGGGLVLKVSALIASGALATGIAVTHVSSTGHHKPAGAAAARHHAVTARHANVTPAPQRGALAGQAAVAVTGGAARTVVLGRGGVNAGRGAGFGSGRGQDHHGGGQGSTGGHDRGSGPSAGNTHGGRGGGGNGPSGSGSSGSGDHSGSGDTLGGGGGTNGTSTGSGSGASGSSSGHGDTTGSDGGGSGGHDGASVTTPAKGDTSPSFGLPSTPVTTNVSGGSQPGDGGSASGSGTSSKSGGSGGQDAASGSGGGSGRQSSSGSRDLSGSADSSST